MYGPILKKIVHFEGEVPSGSGYSLRVAPRPVILERREEVLHTPRPAYLLPTHSTCPKEAAEKAWLQYCGGSFFLYQ